MLGSFGKLFLPLLAALLFPSPDLLAAPPANDAFTSSQTISTFPAALTGTNADATLEAGEPAPGVTADATASVWFSWTPTTSGPVFINTAESTIDTVLGVWTGDSPATLAKVATSYYFGGHEWSAVFFDAVAGTTYRIAVYSYGTEGTGAFNLNIGTDTSGRISGTVTGPDGTTPLAGVAVTAYAEQNAGYTFRVFYNSAETGSDGTYTIRGLPTGSYAVGFFEMNHRLEYHDDTTDLYAAALIGVTAGATTSGIDASLTTGGKISGTVTGPDGATPLAGITVHAYRWNADSSYWEYIDGIWVETAGDGSYTLGGLATGTYRVGFNDYNGNYMDEYYDNAAGGYYGVYSATDVVVTAGTTTPGIDASLAAAGKITGKVTGPDGVTPLAGIQVWSYIWDTTYSYWTWAEYGQTASDGSYTVGGLKSGTYRINFSDSNGNYFGEYYNNAADRNAATDITVTVGVTTSGINASLAVAGKITGKVTGPDGVTPLVNIMVYADSYMNPSTGWTSAGQGATSPDGSYTIGGLATGTYRVQFIDYYDVYHGEYIAEYYNNAADVDTATDVAVTTGATTSGIDASLAAAGKISGKVTGPDGVTSLAGVTVSAYREEASPWGGTYWTSVANSPSASDGTYGISGLTTGTYRVGFRDTNGNYLDEYYNNAADVNSATDVVVTAGATTPGIDASLGAAGKITGKVTGPDGVTPLAGIQVSVVSWTSTPATTASDGSYTIGGLATGTYRVHFSDTSGDYAPEYYDNTSDYSSSTHVAVTEGATTPGINASLSAAGKITGKVTGPDGVTPLAGIQVTADNGTSAMTAPDGTYTIGGLATGIYTVRFSDNSGNYASEYYDNTTDYFFSAMVMVTEGATTPGINASLSAAGKITGKVTGPDGVTPLAGIQVTAYSGPAYSPWTAVYVQTASDGTYTVGGLASGTYRVGFGDYSGTYIGEYYSNAPDVDAATDVAVTAGATTSGIDASLALPAPTVEPQTSGFTKTGNGSYEMQFTGSVGHRYQLQESTNLTEWTDVGAPFTCTEGGHTLQCTGSGPSMFWRVVLVP